MATRIRTIDFLPEIFQTNTNDQFLSATLDQLVQPPDFRKVQGYIGSKFGYGVKEEDQYVQEPTIDKTNYQLEPTIVITDPESGNVTDAITYPGIIDALRLESGLQPNHNSLFKNEFYSWDSFVNLDKLINFGQYYWIPEGPESVDITTSTVLQNATIKVISNANSYEFEVNGRLLPTANPILTLVRGGTYTFIVDETSKFWIQSLPGMEGVDPNKTNFSTRQIQGIAFNGINSGRFVYNVPSIDAQNSDTFSGLIPVDLVTTLRFDEIHGRALSEIKNIDGVIDIENKTLLFYGEDPTNRVRIGDLFDSVGFDTADTLTPGFEGFQNEAVTGTVFKITLIGDLNYPIVKLTPNSVISDNTNIVINAGVEYIGRSFVKNSYGEIKLIPPNTSKLDLLYYQSEANSNKFGKIKLIDKPSSAVIDVLDIIGQQTYTSPNGIKFSNGLRVKFIGNIVPTKYLADSYYVEGVGTSIQLIPSSVLIVPELYSQSVSAPFDDPASAFDQAGFSDAINLPSTPDYITINRGSIDLNGWSRGNRWFHVDVLKTIIDNNPLSPVVNKALINGSSRASRPIIEFYSNLKLIYHGNFGKIPVDYIDYTRTDALSTITGASPDNYKPDGDDSSLFDGCRIIFANDNDPYVVNKIYVATIATVNNNRVVTLTKASDGDVTIGDQIVIVNGTTHKGYNYYYDFDGWVVSQTKTKVNQTPLFDLFDENGISLSDGNYYPGTDFAGCTLFQYSVGSGVKDSVLGIPIQYSGIGNLNDINFETTLNSATFNYVNNNQSFNAPVNYGYVYQFIDKTSFVRKLGWETAVDSSFQYQIFNYVYYNNNDTNSFTLDIPLKNSNETKWPTSVVYINNSRISEYTTTVTTSTTTVTINAELTPGDAVTIMAYSDVISNLGYYQTPSNLQQNPFNDQITTINAGDIRGHYKSICNNIPNLKGAAFGANNYRDLGNPVPYGTRIIQNSASIVTPAAFIRKQDSNFFNSLSYNATEYVKFKALLINTVNSQDYTPYDSASSILDDALDIITSSKTQTTPFFWSDMVPCKTPTSVNSYTFAVGVTNTVYPLSKIYNFNIANYESVLVYTSKLVNGIMQYTQLLKDVDYFVSNDAPYAIIAKQLEDGDVVTVKEYTQTYGNYVPNTPTKLGLYPKFIPDIILDNTYLRPTYFIKGHDGSLTKLYGDFDEYGNLIDFRDKVLFEFERRIFNNIKVTAKTPLVYADVFPGQFRNTDYTYDQVMQLYTTSLLNWIGLNRVDIARQYYDSTNEYTWNYNKAKNKIDNTVFKQGNWRGIYLWFYDTASPHATPWEMIGLQVKPIWWDDRYGLGPYTSDNTLLWDDLSKGFIYNNGDSFIDSRYARPNLLDILPVNSKGELLSPFESVVRNYSKMSFNTNWAIGDVGPAEYSYLKSSTWPFDLMRIFALAKPAQFFALGLNLDVYKYNYEFKQYLVYNRFRSTGNQPVRLYGHDDNSASHSYLNWVIDYLYNYGLDATKIVENLLTFVDVRLSYRMSGYTDKNKINFYIEKGSPNSTSSSLMIPDDSYDILQYKNEPDETIAYSSVIIQKTENGYRVFGNSQTHTYFISSVANSNSAQRLITVLDLQLYVNTDFSTQLQYTTYGNEFNNVTDLANFLVSYGNYLTSQGIIFDDVENGVALDWDQMVAEMMYWTQTGWETGSVINLNPCSNSFHIERNTGIIQPFTFYQRNFVLNQNLVPVNLNDLAIYRKDTTFKVKILNNGDTISYLRADTSIAEHIVIFDNQTVFNDIVYNLITGLRQQRLYVKGTKTNQWDGTIYAPGFIQNENNVENWKENTKYTKGTIVLYKRKYWMANKLVIVPSNTFDYNDWILTNYDKVDIGILGNPNTRASESENYYDTHRSNIQNDGDLLGFSLIGYRPRSYLAGADLDDISQVNIYQNMIAQKGTMEIANSFQGATVQNNNLSYTINENWAIKNSEYGGILNHNFIDLTLDETLLTGNPAIVSVVNGNSVDISQQEIPLYNIKNYGRLVDNINILPTVGDRAITSLPSAGYANLDDITLYSYTVERIDDTLVNLVYKNDYIWIADKQNDWGVYTPAGLDNSISSLVNNLNDTCTLNFTQPHGLIKHDVIAVINSDDTTSVIINGFHIVQQILNNKSILINLSLQSTVTNITFSKLALLYKFQLMRVSSPNKINSLSLIKFEYDNVSVWVDQAANNNWAVYQKSINYTDISFDIFDINNEELGAAVAYVPPLGYYISDPGKGKVYKYIRSGTGDIKTDVITHGTGYGTAMARNSEFMIVSEPSDTISKLYIYRIVALPEVEALVQEQILTVAGTYVGTSMAFSGDSNYLFVGAPKINSVFYFQKQVDYTLLPAAVTKSKLLNVSNVVANNPSVGTMTVTFSGSSYALISLVNVGSTITLSGFTPALTSTGQKVNGKHVVTGVTTKPGFADQVVTVSFALTGTWTKSASDTYGTVTYNPQPVVGQLATQTNISDKFFIVNGYAVDAIPAGKRITFLQYKQLGSSVLTGFGYDPQPGYDLAQARAATVNSANGVFGTDRRKYYYIFTGEVTDGVHFSLDPTIDNKDYVATSANATYSSGSNTTKIYINEFIAAVGYAQVFILLDQLSQTAFTIPVTSRSPKVFTYTNLLSTYLTVLTGEYDATTDTTKIYTVERVGYTISITAENLASIGATSDTFINTVNNQFNLVQDSNGNLTYINMSSYDAYNLGKNPGDLSDPDNPVNNRVLNQSDDNFGATIAVNHDASKIFIGSPTYHVRLSPSEAVPPVPSVGVVWSFNRLIETFQVQYTPQEFADYVVVMPWNFAPTTIVTLNGVALSRKQYAIVAGIAIKFAVKVKAGDIITVSSPNLVLTQVLTSYEDINGVIPNQRFGTSIACNSTGSEVLIGSPYDHTVEGQQGAVYRFTNEGKRYGYVTALIAANLESIDTSVTYLFINGYSVYLDISTPRDATYIASQINNTQVPNVFAYVTEDQRLIIRLLNIDLGSDNNKLNLIMFNGTYFYQLGIAPYVKTQIIREPHAQNNSKFGYRIAFNEQNSFVVTSPEANRYAVTAFDKIAINMHYNTVFDLNLTTFEDVFYNAGAAYMFDYIKPYDESLGNTGQYIYAQPINDNSLVYGALPLYGNSISFNDNIVMIGSPGYRSDSVGGRVNVFENLTGMQNWSVYRTSSRVVDVDQIQKVQLYNNLNDTNLASLDYIDPLYGKLLGAVRENLDFIGIIDPAGYSNPNMKTTSIVWNTDQIGKTWFNTNTTKFLNYHQNDLSYNYKHWGQVFPGSAVTVYTWIESDVTPAFYTGLGSPYDLQKYTVAYAVNSNNGLVQKYYYWVRNTNTLYGDKTLSDSILERYISSPQNSGIPYMAPLSPSTYALYNAREYINDTQTNMHLGFSTGTAQSTTQKEFKLIQTNSESDFLPGLPNYKLGNSFPNGLYNRLLESFAGIDETGASVPNYTLPQYMQIGVNVRPRQSMFINRFGALKNYLEYANNVLSQYPINEFSNLTYLGATGAFFDASIYWSNIYWWAAGYDNKTKTKVEVGMYSDLFKVSATEGFIAGVAKNGQGKREVYLYTNNAWTRIGLQDGTIKFSDKLWDYQKNKIGFGDNFFDTVGFDTFPAVETYYIIRALNEQIYTGPLLEHRNKSLILMFEYIQSENVDGHNYLPWLNKTSFADVTFTVRELREEVNYHEDNTTLLSGYINEVKPYHTIIKDFNLRYTNTDVVYSNTSDFDIAPLYNAKTGKFISPQLKFINTPNAKNEYGIGDSIWSNSNYASWYNHHGLALNGINDFELGILTLYMTPTSNTLVIDNARGMPDVGVLYIEDEIIGYASVNRETGLVSGLTRGINNSFVSIHYPGVIITTDLPGVVVLETGRDYVDPPTVTAYIDTTKYPAPTREAVLQPVMAGGKVIAIDILDPGENYPVTPEIMFTGSFTISFTQTNLNFINDTILIPSTKLTTGDLIKSTCVNGNGSITDGYYYVYVVAQIEDQEIVSITLHKTLTAGLIGRNRIKLNPGLVASVTLGTEYTFSVTARAIAITTNLNVRGILNTLRFDRTSYVPKVVQWEPNKFWGSRYSPTGLDNINSVSSDVSLYYGRAYNNLTGPVTNPSTSTGIGAVFTVTNVLLGGTYNATLTNSGNNYKIFDTITIPGATLSGTTPTNNCLVTVDTTSIVYRNLLQDTTSGIGTDARFNITVSGDSSELAGALILTQGSNTVRGASNSTFSGTINGTTLTATWISGTIEVGARVTGTNIQPYTYIVANLTGSGTTGVSTWTISNRHTISVSENYSGVGSNFYYELANGSSLRITDSTNVHQCTLATVNTVVSDSNSSDFNKQFTITSNYTGQTGIYFARVAVSAYKAEIDNVFYPGANYAENDTIIITGDRLGGTHPENDLTIRVDSVDDSGKILRAAGIGLGLGTAPTLGPIKKFTVNGESLDSNFASLQGAVMPIQSLDNDHGVSQDASGNVIVRLDYYPSALEPGQIQGAKTYFYHNSAPYIYTGSDGTILEVHRPRFDPDDIEQNYFIKIINGGARQHYVGEKIKISGALLGGVARKNDVTITVTQIGDRIVDVGSDYIGVITGATCEGTSVKAFDMYYVKPITMTQVEVFYDPGMKRPVKYIDFVYTNNNDFYEDRPEDSLDFTPDTPGTPIDYLVEYQRNGLSNISDFAYIPEPFSLGLSYRYDFNSYVTYDNRVWRCEISNNDTVFDLSKWKEIESGDRSINALDRIVAYYAPAINMPAKDLQQLVRGISYPGNVYYGNSFSPEDIIPIDIALRGPELYPRTLDIKSIITNRELITGALSLVNGSRNVTGIGTLFNKELAYNIRLYIDDVEYVVASVVNNYTITLVSNYSGPDIITTAYKFQYVAIGESSDRSLLLNSNDGVTWNNNVLAENSLNVTSMVYAEGKYLVSTLSTNNPMLLSYDGLAWLGQGQSTLFDIRGYDDASFDSSPESYPADSVNKVIHAADGFYYGVGSFITRSVDGIIWYKQYDFGTKTLNFINTISEVNTNAFTGFIAVGSGNQILSGSDTAAPVVTKTSVIITSLDGRVWTLQNPYLTPSALNVVLSNSDIIVVAGENGKLWYSVNGFNWSPASVSGGAVTSTLNAGIYANSRFVVVGDNGTILTSTDGIIWVQRTASALTTDKLTDVMYDGLRYYVVGNNATIIRSSNAINWASVSLLTPAEPDSVVAGHDFLYGYGPEELVPGILTESLSIKVTTSFGSNWDNTPLISTPEYYQNTGFGMKSVTSTTNIVDFSGLFKNPAQISVFLLDSTTKLGNRIYSGFTVNWITKVVTLNSSLPANKVLMVEAYEVGNGKLLSRSNSQIMPLRIDKFTGNSEIYLNQPYTPIVNTPIIYCNGVKLLYQNDYDITFTDDANIAKILFNSVYDQETDYISWAILDTSLGDFRTPDIGELSYSIPETETFTGSATDTFVLANNIGGLNVDNAIVEKNGIRLPVTDYVIDFVTLTLTLTNSILSSDTVAVTTFNETDRLFLRTIMYTATADQTAYPLPQGNIDPIKGSIYYTEVNKLWVTVNGLRVGAEKLRYDVLTQSFRRSTDKVKTLSNYPAGTDSSNILVKKNGIKLKPVTDYLIDLFDGTLTMENDVLISDIITIDIYNNLIIDAPISVGDEVMITATLDGSTPSETIFTINVDKYGQPNVYRSNEGDGTWLTSDFNLGDTEIQVYTVDPLLDTLVQTTIVSIINEKIIAYVECDVSDVRLITVYNQTASAVATNYLLEVVDGRAALVFANNLQVSADDTLVVTLKVGTILEINGEKISYTSVDFLTNAISGLTRGVLGTSPVLLTAKYTEIYGITKARTLDPSYYGTVWHSSEYSDNFGDPLQISTTPAAKFLRSGQY